MRNAMVFIVAFAVTFAITYALISPKGKLI